MAFCSVFLTVYLSGDKGAKFGAMIGTKSLWKGPWKFRVWVNEKHINGKRFWVRTVAIEADMKKNRFGGLKYGFIKKVFS